MQIKKMYSRVMSQIFTWAGEEPLVVGYDGQSFVVPPRHETARILPGGIYRFESARDAGGSLVPGTLLVTDLMANTEDGGTRSILSVSAFCDYLTRDRDDLFARGFNIVATAQEVKAAIEQGIPLYEASQDERARTILATELERRKKFEEKGQPAPPSSSDHRVAWSIKHLKTRAQAQVPSASTDEIFGALQGRYMPESKPEVVPTLSRVSSGQEVYEQAVEAGVQLSKTELTALLANDAEQTGYVMEKIKARRAAATAAVPPA